MQDSDAINTMECNNMQCCC